MMTADVFRCQAQKDISRGGSPPCAEPQRATAPTAERVDQSVDIAVALDDERVLGDAVERRHVGGLDGHAVVGKPAAHRRQQPEAVRCRDADDRPAVTVRTPFISRQWPGNVQT